MGVGGGVRVVLRLGDEATPPATPPRCVLRHCLSFLSHEQQKLLWDQSDISSARSRLASPSTAAPAPLLPQFI